MTPANSAFRFRYKGWDGIVPHINSSSTCMMLYIYMYFYMGEKYREIIGKDEANAAED